MKYETFCKRFNEGIYKEGEKFWVCDVKVEDDGGIGSFQRKLVPTEVVCLLKTTKKTKNEIYFVKTKKDGTPSKTTVSIYGPLVNAQPFSIFETQVDCEECYSQQLKRRFLEINQVFDEFKDNCRKAMGGILAELQEF